MENYSTTLSSSTYIHILFSLSLSLPLPSPSRLAFFPSLFSPRLHFSCSATPILWPALLARHIYVGLDVQRCGCASFPSLAFGKTLLVVPWRCPALAFDRATTKELHIPRWISREAREKERRSRDLASARYTKREDLSGQFWFLVFGFWFLVWLLLFARTEALC